MNLNHFSEKVAKNEIIIDSLWYKECSAINIQYFFDQKEQLFFQSLQSNILKKSGEPLLICPPNSLHISISFVLNVKETFQNSKDQIWENIKDECLEELDFVAQTQAVIKVVFEKLIATDSAVIAIAPDIEAIQELRRKINKVEPIRKWGKNYSNIVHTTLFRYKEKLNNPVRFQHILDEYRVNCHVTIPQFDLVKELRYPSIETELIKSFSFRK